METSDIGRVLGPTSGFDFHLVMRPGDVMNHEIQKELELIYRAYPRKLGKSQGMRVARNQCKTLKTVEELRAAVRTYAKFLMETQTEPQFVMYFSTFMNQWRDWLDPEQGAVTLPKTGPKLNPEAFE